jgi:hypothetical protein
LFYSLSTVIILFGGVIWGLWQAFALILKKKWMIMAHVLNYGMIVVAIYGMIFWFVILYHEYRFLKDKGVPCQDQ